MCVLGGGGECVWGGGCERERVCVCVGRVCVREREYVCVCE